MLTSSNGKEALQKIVEDREEIDLLMTDVVMPGMHGTVLAESAREKLPQLKVIFMSGYSSEILSGNFAEDEKYFYLQKPISPLACHERLKEVLNGVQAKRLTDSVYQLQEGD